MYKKVWITFSALIILVAMFFLIVPGMLSYENRIPANILVVEGWLPQKALNVAYQEFQSGNYDLVLFTGSMLREHTTLYINSFLIVYPSKEIVENNTGEHLFEIYAKSSLGVKDSAHFVFWINDKAVADYYTMEDRGMYTFLWEGDLTGVDSLMIQYTNDMYSRKGDRNLVIKSLGLNGSNVITEDTPRFVDKGSPFGRYRWNVKAASHADMAANYFLERLDGKEKEKVVSVSNPYSEKRRTYGNALALSEWFRDNRVFPVKVNVVSIDYHSRRTWMVYNKVLGEDFEVGILSVENVMKETSVRNKYIYLARESLAMLYYCIFILPWI